MSDDDDTPKPSPASPTPLPPETSQRQHYPTPPTGIAAYTPPTYPLDHPDCVRTADECRHWRDEQGRTLKTLEAAMSEHKLRLENGSRVFTDIKTEIGDVRTDMKEIAKATQPKPVDWFRITTWGFTVLMAVLASWWALSQKFAERPTTNDLDKIILTHVNSEGHPTMVKDVRAVHDEQIKQSGQIDMLQKTINETRTDVKEIKTAVGVRPSPSPPSSPTPAPP